MSSKKRNNFCEGWQSAQTMPTDAPTKIARARPPNSQSSWRQAPRSRCQPPTGTECCQAKIKTKLQRQPPEVAFRSPSDTRRQVAQSCALVSRPRTGVRPKVSRAAIRFANRFADSGDLRSTTWPGRETGQQQEVPLGLRNQQRVNFHSRLARCERATCPRTLDPIQPDGSQARPFDRKRTGSDFCQDLRLSRREPRYTPRKFPHGKKIRTSNGAKQRGFSDVPSERSNRAR